MPIEDYSKIDQDFQNQIDELKNSIERVGLRQDELKTYIFEVTDSINELKAILASLPKEAYEAKGKLHMAMQKNYEVITKLYDTISSFESVRQRYQQDAGRLTKDKLYFINIELRRIEDKTDSSSGSVLKFMKELQQMIKTVQSSPEISNQILGSLEDKPEYNMD